MRSVSNLEINRSYYLKMNDLVYFIKSCSWYMIDFLYISWSPDVGLEPTATRLKVWRSTNWANPVFSSERNRTNDLEVMSLTRYPLRHTALNDVDRNRTCADYYPVDFKSTSLTTRTRHRMKLSIKITPTTAGFEPARIRSNGLAGRPINHSGKLSY